MLLILNGLSSAFFSALASVAGLASAFSSVEEGLTSVFSCPSLAFSAGLASILVTASTCFSVALSSVFASWATTWLPDSTDGLVAPFSEEAGSSTTLAFSTTESLVCSFA